MASHSYGLRSWMDQLNNRLTSIEQGLNLGQRCKHIIHIQFAVRSTEHHYIAAFLNDFLDVIMAPCMLIINHHRSLVQSIPTWSNMVQPHTHGPIYIPLASHGELKLLEQWLIIKWPCSWPWPWLFACQQLPTCWPASGWWRCVHISIGVSYLPCS